MGKRNNLKVICLLLAATALFWGVVPGRVQAEEAKAITGPFRDPESVPKLRSTTSVQREEAARKAAEFRNEAARAAALKKSKPSGSPPIESTVPLKSIGGTNE